MFTFVAIIADISILTIEHDSQRAKLWYTLYSSIRTVEIVKRIEVREIREVGFPFPEVGKEGESGRACVWGLDWRPVSASGICKILRPHPSHKRNHLSVETSSAASSSSSSAGVQTVSARRLMLWFPVFAWVSSTVSIQVDEWSVNLSVYLRSVIWYDRSIFLRNLDRSWLGCGWTCVLLRFFCHNAPFFLMEPPFFEYFPILCIESLKVDTFKFEIQFVSLIGA